MILGADYATGNMGVDALLTGTLASIARARADLRVHLLTYGRDSGVTEVPVEGRLFHLKPVNLRFSWRLHLRNNVFRLIGAAALYSMLPGGSIRRWWLDRNPPLRHIHATSLCASIAGGDSFSDIYGARRFLYICLPQILVLLMERPLVQLPQTIGPFKALWARGVAGWILRRSATVFARDRESLRVAREITGGAAEPRFSHDMAFALEPTPPEDGGPPWLSGDGPLVGINVSGLLFRADVDGGNAFGLRTYAAVLEDFILWLIKEQCARAMLVTHVTGGGESDARACRDVYEKLASDCEDRLHLADPGFNHREIKHLIGRCDFFAGARMHACIAALSQGVPAAGMAYSRKFAGVFASVGAEELVVDLRVLDGPAAFERLKSLFVRRETHAERLRPHVEGARRAAEGLIGEVMDQPPPHAGSGVNFPALARG
jgi:colanic acid/amylovoran biosynthesis protein